MPDRWRSHWSDYQGQAWYRIDWHMQCEAGPAVSAQPLAVAIDHINMAGAVFINGHLLWRDASLVEPLSRSWNMPRLLTLPQVALQPGGNTLWIQVAGSTRDDSGLGEVLIATQDAARQHHERTLLLRRTLPFVNLVGSAILGCFFLACWLLRRSRSSYGWYALASFAWVLLASNIVITTLPPGFSTAGWLRFNLLALILFVSAFCMFLWRFGGQRLPRLERCLLGLGLACSAALLVTPAYVADGLHLAIFWVYALIFSAECIQFPFRAWRTGKLEHWLLAVCTLGFLVAAVHDALLVQQLVDSKIGYSIVSSLLGMVGMALVLALDYTRTLRQVENFNIELGAKVQAATEELAAALEREHAQAIHGARLGERLRIAHDLHDGLGSTLVREIARLEQMRSGMTAEQCVSMLKLLRDDLRQVVDSGSGSALPQEVARTPLQWLAPVRHRFGQLFEARGMRCEWEVGDAWPVVLTSAQLLGLCRVLEEALTNVLKHSQASCLHVCVAPRAGGGLELMVDDNGIGFDTALVDQSLLGIGLRSMSARMARMGGHFHITSQPGHTRVQAWL
ncbi:histidine kinase [Corticibacter populi]|uniref:Histidine kinase n=1 Tax=Corticibacter populi TaxID=1550736 RepID=A0A3M6QSD6_9BURK|nr:ATP-binding protein [Corticibacter populi]RMX05761.1 histidine kinase [Corticibacter populi]RZS30938.1 signal transduction histidine kinase [Corticibacter populi]